MTVSGHMRKKVRCASGLALTVVVAILVAGCGAAKTLSHSALVSKANADCQLANSAVSKLGAPTASLSALTGYATKVLPISEQLVTKLAALKPASSDQTSLNGLVSALKNGNRGLQMMKTATSITATNTASKVIIAQSVPKAATALGATTCAASPSAS